MNAADIRVGDAATLAAGLPPGSVHCVVTSPPYYGQRAYLPGDPAEIGGGTVDEYVGRLVSVFERIRPALADGACVFVNIGDSYARNPKRGGSGTNTGRNLPGRYDPSRRIVPDGVSERSLLGIPWRFALAMQAAGWAVRSEIVWHKPNAMPEGSTDDRPHRDHEVLFMFTRGERARWRSQARTVWSIHTEPGKYGHPAPFPRALARKCIESATSPGETVLDPFVGSGTTLVEARALGRIGIGFELNAAYIEAASRRLSEVADV